MGSVNRVIVVGNLGRDPEVRFSGSSQAVANFSVATSEKWKDKSGQMQERTEWHRVVAWGKLGELCGQHLKKGRTAYVEGRLQTREWQDKDGGKRTATEIVASNVVFLGGRGSGEHEQATSEADAESPRWSQRHKVSSAGGEHGQPEAEPDNIPF
jgi:single-strand DNA-binding protein